MSDHIRLYESWLTIRDFIRTIESHSRTLRNKVTKSDFILYYGFIIGYRGGQSFTQIPVNEEQQTLHCTSIR